VKLEAFLVINGKIPSLGFGSAAQPIRPTCTTFPRRAFRRWKTSISGLSTACATPAIQPFQRQRRAVLDRTLQAEAAVITNMHSDLDYEVLRRRCRRRDPGL